MSDAPAADAKEKPKSKKMIIIIAAAVLLLGGGGAGYFLLMKKNVDEDGDEKPAASASHDSKKVAPTYLPLENMVVNLADPGGDRFAQIGVTFEIEDAHAADQVKAYLPKIRDMILRQTSQRTSEELLTTDGKEKLAGEVLKAASRILGFEPEDEEEESPKAKKKKKAKRPESPLTAVLFSNFIVQ